MVFVTNRAIVVCRWFALQEITSIILKKLDVCSRIITTWTSPHWRTPATQCRRGGLVRRAPRARREGPWWTTLSSLSVESSASVGGGIIYSPLALELY